MEKLEISFGDWELSETDPLSPSYRSRLNRGFEKLIETFHYIFNLYFGKENRKNIKREEYGLLDF